MTKFDRFCSVVANLVNGHFCISFISL